MARLDQGSALALVFLVLFCSATVVSSRGNTQGVDRTLEDGADGDDVVTATANKIRESGIFGDDHDFLRRMARVESEDGTTIVPGMGGIWRIDEDTFMRVEQDIQTPCKNQQQNTCLQDQFQEEFCFDWSMDVRTKGYRAMDVPLYSALYVMVYLVRVQQVTTIPEDIESQANIWVDNFNLAREPQEFVDVATDLQDEQCTIKGVDMVFVMDESGSIGVAPFERMKQLAIDVTSTFEIAPNRTRVGWVSFNRTAWVVFGLTDYENEQDLHNAINGITFSGGATAIGEGLNVLRLNGFEGARDRFDIAEVAIVVTDGRTNLGVNTSYAAELLRAERNVSVFAVGIGAGVNVVELNTIASAGNRNDPTQNVYHINDFEKLTNLQQIIRSQTCSDIMKAEYPQQIERLNRNNLNIPQDVTAHATVNCPQEGLTIGACSSSGTTNVYASGTSSPNSANFDKSITVMAGTCRDMFVGCSNGAGTGRRRRQESNAQQRIFVTIEGVEEENEYDLSVTPGDSSTPQVNLLCRKRVDTQSMLVSCNHDRELTDIKCSINGSPLQPCNLPWTVALTPPVREYTIRIEVVDALNLTDTVILKHTVGPLALDCSLNSEMQIVCLSSKPLDLNKTLCTFRETTVHQCILPYKIAVKGWPLGTHVIHVSATDVFGSSAEAAFEYIVIADRVGDDMVFSVVLDISPNELNVSDHKTVSLCYQVHGEEEKFYNLVTDDCLSVNAHVTQPVSGVKSHVIDKIGIRAIGNNATYCYDIGIARENCAVTVNGNPISVNEKFTAEGIEVFNDRMIARKPNVIRISVPNCGRALVDAMQITCTEYNMRVSRTETEPVEVLELTTTRGISPIEAAHGLVGQFWGRFMLGRSQSPLPSPRQRYDKAVMIFHDATLQRFDGFVRRSWSHSREMCFYAGDRQGYPVLQGEYGDYEVETMFGTEYPFSRFKQDMCMSEDGSSM
jgi:hypothetical protein